ncbi:uncharacterized protein BDZ99DRAFT_472434 [Mytilinidion resinicola]|uniref:Uncharacterized protein n=1 Tax=Mytilinidion resinicola TaxID=574789 RepID=A0A6A6Z342_9PEZI|nr:uncharacterized protein BDZ99DRAFT_472434 [Mytilinidion resinicola]KAF2815093.1 hypothetical protein BDZ99DRAFT_472434 [Mytilinidion resinicola]
MAEVTKPKHYPLRILSETAAHYLVERAGIAMPTLVPKASCPQKLIDAWTQAQADNLDERESTKALLNELEIAYDYDGPVPRAPKHGFPTDFPEFFGYPRPVAPVAPRTRNPQRQEKEKEKDAAVPPPAPAPAHAPAAPPEPGPHFPWDPAYPRVRTSASQWAPQRPAPFDPQRARVWGPERQEVVGCEPGHLGLFETLGMGWSREEMDEFVRPVREAKEREEREATEREERERERELEREQRAAKKRGHGWLGAREGFREPGCGVEGWVERFGRLEGVEIEGVELDEMEDSEEEEVERADKRVDEVVDAETEGEDGSVGFEVVESEERTG